MSIMRFKYLICTLVVFALRIVFISLIFSRQLFVCKICELIFVPRVKRHKTGYKKIIHLPIVITYYKMIVINSGGHTTRVLKRETLEIFFFLYSIKLAVNSILVCRQVASLQCGEFNGQKSVGGNN